MNNKNTKVKPIIILIIVFIIILYLLILKFGNIEHYGPKVPTGNVDIFEINCKCQDCTSNDIDKNKQNNVDSHNYLSPKGEEYAVVAYDNYKIYDTKELRIFENPSYEFREIIAPGSENSYTFMIRNTNDFDIHVNLVIEEENEYNFNMKYKLKSKGEYIAGSDSKYDSVSNLNDKNVLIKANSYKTYVLDWKWLDSDNDTDIGINDNANYKLKINIFSINI